MRIAISFIVLTAVATLAGCGHSPDDGAKRTVLKLESSEPASTLTPSGRPEAPLIDPAKKNVVVLAAPSAPQLVEKQEAKLVADRDRTQTDIHGLMDGYSANLNNAANKEKYRQQIAQRLETYKRQSLELFLLQQQQRQAAGQ